MYGLTLEDQTIPLLKDQTILISIAPGAVGTDGGTGSTELCAQATKPQTHISCTAGPAVTPLFEARGCLLVDLCAFSVL